MADTAKTAFDEDELVRRVHANYHSARDHSDTWREQAITSYAFYAGEQWNAEDRIALNAQGRPAVTFNRIGVVVDAVVGTEINNRQESRYIPREQGDVQVNELLSGAAAWVRDGCDAEDEESDAFSDLVVCGMGWTETRIEYETDPNGKILIERVDPLEMYWDPAARKKNVADARWVMRVKVVDREDAEAMWPALGEVATTSAPWDGFSGEDGPLDDHVYPQDAYKAERALGGDSARGTGKQQVRVAQFQWRTYAPVYRVQNPATGEIEDLDEAAFDKLKLEIEVSGVPYVKQRKAAYRQAFIAGGTVLAEGPCPYAHGFTLRAMTGKRDRNHNIWFGLVRAMEDPQRWANKFFSQILHILNLGAKGGIIAEQDAFEDPRKVEENWARPDSIMWTRPGAIAKGAIMPKPVAEYPTGLDRLMEFSVSSVRDVSGVNLELLGLAERQQAGVLEYQRRESGIMILANLFDGLRKYRKEQGRVLLHFITEYINDGRLIRITGQDGTERFVPFVKAPGTSRYDVIVDEAPTSPNQKEKVFGVLQAMLPAILAAGIPLPPEILDYAPLPSSLTERWKQLIKGAAAPADEGPAAQLAFAAAAADVEKERSQAQLNLARAQHEQAKAASLQDRGA